MNKQTMTDAEMYKKGYDILIEQGWTHEEISGCDEMIVMTVCEARAISEGAMTYEADATLILETGERVEGRPVQKYIHETYEQALKRELDEAGEEYNPADILKSAVVG